MNELITAAGAALEARGFQVLYAESREQAAQMILDLLKDAKEIACGGSVTIRDLGIAEAKKQEGAHIWWHWMAETDNRTIFLRSLDADVYLASANAITVSGQIVNIDATGNRVGAMAYGPKQVILAVGRNKLVRGGVPQAIARIKREACPSNARRLNRDTWCAAHNTCNPAACANTMCRITEVLDHPPVSHPFTIVLIDEDMGY